MVRKTEIHLLWLVATACCSTVVAEEETTSTDIAPQPLNVALRKFADQSGLQVVYRTELAAGIDTNGTDSPRSDDEALDQLLASTGLEYRFVNDRTVAIQTMETEAEDPWPGKPRPASKLVLVAQNRTSATQSNSHQTSRSDDEVNDAKDTPNEVDEIVVTGTSIRGVVPESAPLEIFTAEDIAKSGATTLERFFETLPQNLNSISPQSGPAMFGPGTGEIGEYGIDLRGLGVGTTLVLLNGTRLTAQGGGSPDISLIPTEAIERVEILTDGASAVYGADAIGGVVNIILRDDLDGGQTSLSYGAVTDGGHHLFKVTQSIGTSWGTGHALISYGFTDQSPLRAGDREFARIRDDSMLAPDEQKHSLLVTAVQELANSLSIYGDILYSRRDSHFAFGNEPDGDTVGTNDRVSSPEQLLVSGGVDYSINDNLQLNVHGSFLNSETVRNNRVIRRDLATGLIVAEFGGEQRRDGKVFEFSAKIDGALFDLPAGEVKFSAGGEVFDQEFTTPPVNAGISGTDPTTLERTSQSLFAEVFVPVISEDQSIPGVRRLEVNAAARYTHYEDFSSDVSPRFGLLWSPLKSLNLRGTYAESFRAPTLSELNPLNGFGSIVPLAPFAGTFPDIFSDDGSTVLLMLSGSGGRELTPESSESYTLGFDFRPEAAPGLDISMTYFNIDYKDRIGTPVLGALALFNPEDFPEIYNANPTRADFESIIANYTILRDPLGVATGDLRDIDVLSSAVTVIHDNRLANLAISKTDGLDLSIGYARKTRIGDFNFGGSASYTIDSVQALTPTSTQIILLDSVGNPTSLKFSTHAGISRGGFSGQVNVHYVDRYANVNVTPEESVSSWTTVDLNLSYAFEGSASILRNTALSLNINNLFDRRPPFVGVGSDGPTGTGLRSSVGYDPTNANPIGRFVTAGLIKQF